MSYYTNVEIHTKYQGVIDFDYEGSPKDILLLAMRVSPDKVVFSTEQFNDALDYLWVNGTFTVGDYERYGFSGMRDEDEISLL